MIKSPVGKVQPSPERLAVQMKYMERRYDDVLGKVLEQNALILSSVARMQDDLKTLRTKLETLELSVQEEAAAPKVNGNDSRLNDSLSNQSPAQVPASALAGPALSSMPQQFQPPGHFYNPYTNPMYNPYMMMAADPMSYLMNPTMQYAALYGALSQNPAAAPTVEPPKPTIPPFSFGVSLPTPANDSLNTSNNSSVNLSFSSPKPPVAEPPKKVENGIGGVGLVPKQVSAADNTNKTEVSSIFSPKQLPTTTTTVPKVDTKPATQAVTPPKPISVIGASTPVRPGAGPVVTSVAPASSTAAGISFTGVSTSASLMSSTPTFTFPSKPLGATTSVTTSSIFAPPATTASGVPSTGIKPFTFGFSSSTSQVDGPILSSTLNSSKSVPAVSKDTETKKPDPAPALAPTIDFAALSAKMCSFTDVKPTTTSANPFGEFKGFGTVPVQVFGSTTASSTEARPKEATTPSSSVFNKSGHDEHHEEDDFVPTAEFAPVIPLPPLVEVKKGDENENILFQHRAKLLRFVKETKEWKERGVGDIKILQSKESLGKIRVVMWREKVHKIACNHLVTKEIKVTNYQGSAKNLMWTAIDFAEVEEGPKPEIFVCRFGQEEQAKEFKKQMELAVSLVGDTPTTPEKGDGSKSEGKTEEAKPANLAPLSQMFKKPDGQWSCEACYTDNKKESLACAACTAPKPGAAPVAKPVEVAAPKFSFGFGPPTIAPAAPKDSTAKVESIFSLKSGTAPSSISFGFPSTTTSTDKGQHDTNSNKTETAPKPTTTTAPVLDFAKLSADMPSFGSVGGVSPNNAFVGGGKGWMAGSAQPVFGFAAQKPSDPANVSSTKEGDEPEDDFVPTAEFAPVIPLPPLVEIKKGDENENVLFSHRAKLLRFVKETKEWKERGVGDIKILQAKDKETKIRVVMWREKVHKIACNHWISGDLQVTNYQGTPKNLKWTAVDFAEADVDGPKTEIFVCRFGSEDKAQEFKTQMEKAIAIVKNAPTTPEKAKENVVESTVSTSQKPISELFKKPEGEWTCNACYVSNNKELSSCVSCNTSKPGSAAVIQSSPTTGEGKISDLTAKAESLQLPSNYFTNQCDKPDHPPCRGCEPDTFDFSVLDGRKVPIFEDIPKPQRPQGGETLKDLLTKTTESSKTNTFSTFSFSLPLDTTIVPSTTAQPAAPPFVFKPEFIFTPDKNPVDNLNVPTTIAPYDDGNDEEGEDDDEDDEDEEDTMFVSEGVALYKNKSDDPDFTEHGDGQVKILYDGDHFCARFVFVPSNDDEDLYIDHVIAAETQIKSTGENTFEWDCIAYTGDSTSKGRVKVTFPDQQAFDSFASAMSDSVDIAMQAGVTEEDLSGQGEQQD